MILKAGALYDAAADGIHQPKMNWASWLLSRVDSSDGAARLATTATSAYSGFVGRFDLCRSLIRLLPSLALSSINISARTR